MNRSLSLFLFILMTFCLSACSRYPSHQSQGYVEGRYTYMATSVSGRLNKLLVNRGAMVKAGQMLFVLNPRPEMDDYLAELSREEQALLQLKVIKPNLDFARLTYNRYKNLVPKNAIEQSALDNATANVESLEAQMIQADSAANTAKIAVMRADWVKEQKIVNAPVDGVVFDTYYRLGEYTNAGTPILSLLAPADIKVIFYVSEKYLGGIQVNDSVHIQCDGCKNQLDGKISFISPSAEYTPPVIYSNETNEKLIYRIEAAFAPDIARQLHPGQPVTVTYYTHD